MASDIVAVKVCKKCGEAKPATPEFFNRHKHGAGGLNPRCKTCRSVENADYVKNGGAEVYKRWRDNNSERIKEYREEIVASGRKVEYDKKYHSKHREQCNARRKKHYENNKDAHREASRIWTENNRDKVRAYAREGANRRAKTIKGRIRGAINTRLREMLKTGKGGKSWQKLFGYTYHELKAHLERQFSHGMTWENYGKWHIDHIIPVISFEFNSINDPVLAECWSLSNLRPLWAKENMSKGAKMLFLL